jgi:DNA-directed RNA polymerase specialized sigma24 family protein
VGDVPHDEADSRQAFEGFVAGDCPRLKRALLARYGVEVGVEAYAEALAYGWAHWDRVEKMANPVGYLFRVGQSRSRKFRTRATPVLPDSAAPEETPPDPALHAALWKLSAKYRTAVLLVHGYGLRYREAAIAMNVSEAALRNYLHRAMAILRQELTDSEVPSESD